MRALETEVSRLREAYTTEISDANVTVQQHKEMLHTARTENEILKEILAAHGINYAPELEQRMAERGSLAGFQSSPVAASSSGSNTAAFTNATSNQNVTPATSISTGLSPQATGGVEHADVSPPWASCLSSKYITRVRMKTWDWTGLRARLSTPPYQQCAVLLRATHSSR